LNRSASVLTLPTRSPDRSRSAGWLLTRAGAVGEVVGMAMVPYVVRQGDYLAQIAFRRGFVADRVWSAPENATLREARKDPNILAPGDILHVPDDERP